MKIRECPEKIEGFRRAFLLGDELLGLRVWELGPMDTFEIVSPPYTIIGYSTVVRSSPMDFLSDYPQYAEGLRTAERSTYLGIAMDHMERLDRKSPYCGKGIGTMLGMIALEESKKKGVERMFAQTDTNNVFARSILEKTGFKNAPECRTVWYKDI